MTGHTKAAAKTISVLTAAIIVAGCFGSAAGRSQTAYTPSDATFFPVVVPTATPSPSASPRPVSRKDEPCPSTLAPNPCPSPSVTPAPSTTPKVTPKPTRKPKPTAKPKPRVLRSGGIRGAATWYCKPGRSRCTKGFRWDGAYAAAGPELRAALGDWRGKVVWVNGVRVKLIDFCACSGDHVIDVYHATWTKIPHPDSVVIRW